MLYFGKQEFAFSDALNLALDFECHLILSERTTISTLRISLKIKAFAKQNILGLFQYLSLVNKTFICLTPCIDFDTFFACIYGSIDIGKINVTK